MMNSVDNKEKENESGTTQVVLDPGEAQSCQLLPTTPAAAVNDLSKENAKETENTGRANLEQKKGKKSGQGREEGSDIKLDIQTILDKCPDEHLVPNEVLTQLLKIQSKYLDDHPCLCTSRFRHILHQLNHDQHKKLADLCGQLQKLTTKSSEHLYETTLSYRSFVLKIFDLATLKSGHPATAILDGQHEDDLDSERPEWPLSRLEAILARLVSDYRAIFAIEDEAGEAARSDDSSKFDHEHRKRHEEEDECPEEIKLMKVAWKDFSLKCPSSSSSSSSPSAVATGSSTGSTGFPFNQCQPVLSTRMPDYSGLDRAEPVLCNRFNPDYDNSSSDSDTYSLIQKYSEDLRKSNTATSGAAAGQEEDEGENSHDSRGSRGSHSPASSPSCSTRTATPTSTTPPTPISPAAPSILSAAVSAAAAASTSAAVPTVTLNSRPQKTGPKQSSQGQNQGQGQTKVQAQGQGQCKQCMLSRKRKERQESISEEQDQHDRKLSRSSSAILAEAACDLTCSTFKRCHSTSGVEFNQAPPSEDTAPEGEAGTKKVLKEITEDKKKLHGLFYVADEDPSGPPTSPTCVTSGVVTQLTQLTQQTQQQEPHVALEERKIAHARKPRKERSDSLKENNSGGSSSSSSSRNSSSSSGRSGSSSNSRNKSSGNEGSSSEARAKTKTNPTSKATQQLPDEELLGSSISTERSSLAASSLSTSSAPNQNGAKSSSTNTRNSNAKHSSDYSPAIQRRTLEASLSAPCLPLKHLGGIAPVIDSPEPEGSGSKLSGLTELNNRLWDRDQQATFFQKDPQPVSWVPTGFMREEPMSSSYEDKTESDLSIRSMGMIQSHRYLDPTPVGVSQRRASDPETMRRGKLRNLRRQLSNLRKKMEELELSFATHQGYKPSQADKQGDKNMRKLLEEQFNLKRQIRSCRDCDIVDDFDDTSNDSEKSSFVAVLEPNNQGDQKIGGSGSSSSSSSCSISNNDKDNNNSIQSRDLESMRNTLQDIEQRLRAERQMKSRPFDLETMTADQLMQEKKDLHDAFTQFELLFGTPSTPEEKDLTKDLYDRYRHVKRLVRRSSASRVKEQAELETIPEDVVLPLTLASPPHRINIEVNSTGSGQGQGQTLPQIGCSSKLQSEGFGNNLKSMDIPQFKSVEEDQYELKFYEENLHSLGRYDLLLVLHKTKDEKRHYRRTIKEKEAQFKIETGRRLLKEDRDRTEKIYQMYKKSKAKLKLISALLSKQPDHFC